MAARQAGQAFQIWPFELPTEALLTTNGLIVAEIYPRAAYATALIDAAPRARLRVAKTKSAVRLRAIGQLKEMRWVTSNEVTLGDLDQAAENEDDFDAMITASALLRCVIEDLPLWDLRSVSRFNEGAILGTGSIDLNIPEVTLT